MFAQHIVDIMPPARPEVVEKPLEKAKRKLRLVHRERQRWIGQARNPGTFARPYGGVRRRPCGNAWLYACERATYRLYEPAHVIAGHLIFHRGALYNKKV